MNIAFIDQDSQMGGVEYTTLRTARALDKTRFIPLLICPEEGDLPRLARQSGLNVAILPRPKFESVSWYSSGHYIANPFGFIYTSVNILRSALLLQKYLHANPVQILITKGLMAHFYGGLAARWSHIPCLWYVQEEVDQKRGGGAYRFILVQGAKRLPSKTIVDALALLDQFGDAPQARAHLQVIYNGIDMDEFAPVSSSQKLDARLELHLPENALVIGQAGRLIPLKGQSVLLDAFIRLSAEFPDLHLLLVGISLFGDDAYESALRSQAACSGLTERVHFTGFLPDVRQGLSAMDIFVQASIETDSPVAVLEAMSCGLPVVVSGVRGALEMVEPDADALVFPPGDVNALTLALAPLLRNPALRQALGARARESVLRKFSLQATTAQLESLLSQFAG
jgi:glycosyltransferase involved in cell wall biosynthesis